MRNFLVNVNGTQYQISVEEIDGQAAAAAAAAAPVAAPVAVPAAAPAPVAAPSAGAVAIESPMPGNILKVNVKPGDAVQEGDLLMILEAMKMENEIVAPRDATVAQVVTSKGSNVDTGAPLVVLQ